MRDPLRRDMLIGAALGFVLILATLVICYLGVAQINAARDAQASVDNAQRYVQGTMRGVGELILSEGANAQIKALQANLRQGDEALKALAEQLPDTASRNHFTGKILPAWTTLSGTLTPFATRRGLNAASNETMAAYGKLLGSMEAFEADFARIDKTIGEAVVRATRQAYWMTASALALVLALFILLNVVILRRVRRGLGGDLSYAIAATQNIARGDLASNITVVGHADGSLLGALKTMHENLTRMVHDIRSGAESIRNAAEEVAAGNSNLSQRTEEQAATLEETASSMEELTSAVRENTQSADNVNALVKDANQVATEGGKAVGAVVATMNEIQESSKKIGDIISVIDSIAFQTNILALNAAVEAARAGEQGRGFAVVATEVRALAGRSADAAKEIKALIGNSVEKVETGTRQVENAGKTMEQIVASVEKVTAIINQITLASREQAGGIEQVNKAVGQMDQVVQQNAAVVEQAAAAAESMQANAQQLVESVSVFKLNGVAQAQAQPAAHNFTQQSRPALPSVKAAAPRLAQSRRALSPLHTPPKANADAGGRNRQHGVASSDWKEF